MTGLVLPNSNSLTEIQNAFVSLSKSIGTATTITNSSSNNVKIISKGTSFRFATGDSINILQVNTTGADFIAYLPDAIASAHRIITITNNITSANILTLKTTVVNQNLYWAGYNASTLYSTGGAGPQPIQIYSDGANWIATPTKGWGPVSGEPALGMWHIHNWQWWTNQALSPGNYAVNCTGQVPSGTKAVTLYWQNTSGNFSQFTITDATYSITYGTSFSPNASTLWEGGCAIVPLNSSLTFGVSISSGGMSYIYTWLTGYFI
jgi:hypothetical protein